MDTNRLSMNIIKKVIDNIIKPLTYVCNKSFQEGGFPDVIRLTYVNYALYN